MADFAHIKAHVSIMDVIALLGVEPRQENDQLRMACPSCKKGGDRALVLTPGKGLFYCFPAKVGGDVIALWSHAKDLPVKKAAEDLAQEMRLNDPMGRNPPKQEKSFNPLDYQAKLQTDHELLTACGITPEQAKQWGIGIALKGTHAGKIAFPLYKDGKIDAFGGADEIHLPKRK